MDEAKRTAVVDTLDRYERLQRVAANLRKAIEQAEAATTTDPEAWFALWGGRHVPRSNGHLDYFLSVTFDDDPETTTALFRGVVALLKEQLATVERTVAEL